MKRRTATSGVLATILLALLVQPLQPVSVAPMGVYIDSRTRSGVMTLFNPGDRTEEIRVDFAFGYPQSDSTGNIVVPISDTAPAGEPSALPWLSAFPQRLRLEPGQRQVVRIVARPPGGLEAGEYWARALVHSEGGQEPVESEQDGVSLRIDVKTVVVVPVNYRNGRVETGVAFDEATATMVGDTVVNEITVHRTGNAAFLGRLLIEVLDDSGRVIESTEDLIPVYRTMYRRIPTHIGTERTPVRVRYTIDTNRDDIPPGGLIPAEPVVREVAIG
jgi:hypothetical protein